MDNIPIGTIIILTVDDPLGMREQGYLSMMNEAAIHQKILFPELWEKLQNTPWVQDLGTHFRLRSLTNQFIRGNGLMTERAGEIQGDAVPNIRGQARIRGASGTGIIESTHDAFTEGQLSPGNSFQSVSLGGNWNRLLVFDASRSNSKYRDNSEVRPTNVSAFYYIKATGGFVPNNPTDLQAVLAELQQFTSNTLTEMQQLKDKMNDILGDDADYVVESWTAPDGGMWFRRYKSGWVEQGGFLATGTHGFVSVTLPFPMANTSYSITNGERRGSSSNNGWYFISPSGHTATTIRLLRDNFVSQSWEVKGQGRA